MTKYSKYTIIKSIQDFYKENNRIPTCKDFSNNPAYPSYKTVQKYFITWNSAIETAGYKTTNKHWDKNSCIEAIQLFYEKEHKTPIKKDFEDSVNYPSASTVRNHLGSWNKGIMAARLNPTRIKGVIYKDCSKEGCIEAIQRFYKLNNRIPQTRDFKNNSSYPSTATIFRVFNSWNNAIEAANFKPNVQNGFGIDTFGLDGHLYRSRAEAYFADKFLYEKYNYVVEPKYPDSSWLYDWYIPELNLYIELDGEIRPERIKEKVTLNKQLNRDCLVVKTNDIYSKNRLEELKKQRH